MNWSVVVKPKRKGDVHGVAICLTSDDEYGEQFEASRVAIFRRPDVAAQGEKPFDQVLDGEIAKAEKAAEVMNRLDRKLAENRRKASREAWDEAKKEIEKIFPPRKGGPEFE